jgi:hypothetical protein
MSEEIPIGQAENALENALRTELEQGDRVIATARPILRQLIANDGHSLFNDEVIARIRGMVRHSVRQMLHAVADAIARGGAAGIERDGFIENNAATLAAPLLDDAAFLVHAHTLVLEARLAERLHQRSGIDPVLPPLLQELAASSDAAQAGQAMRVLAAQSRFMQHQRRMEWPLSELPGDLFHKAMLVLQTSSVASAEVLAAAQQKLRQNYDESQRRVDQITRLIGSMERKAVRALALDHAGLAIFVTAMAMSSEQDRELGVLALCDNQFARLALSLRAAGLEQRDAEKQFVFLHPDIDRPPGFASLRPDSAARLLASSNTDGLS